MPSLQAELFAVLHLVAASALGASLVGAESAVSAAVALAVAGLGSVVVMGRRLAAAMGGAREVAVVDWEVEMQGDRDRVRREEGETAEMEAAAAAVRREVMIRQVLEWAAEREERRRRAVERAAVGGG